MTDEDAHVAAALVALSILVKRAGGKVHITAEELGENGVAGISAVWSTEGIQVELVDPALYMETAADTGSSLN